MKKNTTTIRRGCKPRLPDWCGVCLNMIPHVRRFVKFIFARDRPSHYGEGRDAWRGTGPRTTVRGEGCATARSAGACPPQCHDPFGIRRSRTTGARCMARDRPSHYGEGEGYAANRKSVGQEHLILTPFGIGRARTTGASEQQKKRAEETNPPRASHASAAKNHAYHNPTYSCR